MCGRVFKRKFNGQRRRQFYINRRSYQRRDLKNQEIHEAVAASTLFIKPSISSSNVVDEYSFLNQLGCKPELSAALFHYGSGLLEF